MLNRKIFLFNTGAWQFTSNNRAVRRERLLMPDIIFFDVSAIFVLVLLMFSAFYRSQTKSRTDRLFIALLVDATICGIFDILSVSYEYIPEMITFGNGIIYKLAQYGYLLTQNLIPPLYVFFIISFTDSWHNWKKSIRLKCFIFIPAVITLAVFLTNPLTKLLFYFDTDGTYIRGSWFPIVYVYSFLTIFLMVHELIRYRKLFTKEKFITLHLIWIAIMVASILQMFFPYLLITIFAIAMALLLITITVNRAEMYIDSVTRLNGYMAYVEYMRRVFINKKPVHDIIINVSNMNVLHSVFDYEDEDRLMREIAAKLNISQYVKTYNYDVYHINNGRFRIIIEKNDFETVYKAAEYLREELNNGIVINSKEIHAQFHVCLAYIPEDAKDYDELTTLEYNLDASEDALRSVIIASELTGSRMYRLMSNLNWIIRDAIDKNRLQVYYQPIYDVKKGKFTSAEALIRLIDPDYGFVPPDLFIPRAEKNGMIHEIGAFVLNEVCSFIAGGEFGQTDLEYIEINLSMAQCMRPTLAGDVKNVLGKHGVGADRINMEITETSANEQIKTFADNLKKLTEAGISFSIDDYGTGYSNIERIAMIPLKIVKLDRIMVRDDYDEKMWSIVKNTIRMMKDINLKIVVEGVETQKQLETFTQLDCDYIQGYYFSKPLPRDEFVKFLKAH